MNGDILMTMTVESLARALGLAVVGGNPSAPIRSAANLDEATPAQITFISHPRAAARLPECAASAVIVPRALHAERASAATSLLLSDDPEIDFIRCLDLLYPAKRYPGAVSERANVDPGARIGKDTFIDAGVTVRGGAKIGRDCRILAGCYVGDDVEIGDGCTLHPNVVLYHGTILRENVIIHAGTVIGADGYGYKHRNGVHIKFPQVGAVLIERDVEIGANTCIDRAALGLTQIGAGTKIDNHVHIAHNVKIGKGVLILGQTGIGGSAVIEDYAILASQCGISDHVRIGRGAKVLAQAGVIGDVAPQDEVIGFPAASRKQALREMATLRRLVELYRPLKAIVDLLPKLTEMFKSARP
jgi:UDP-3-O-[3-hydroxymyristoyl] glucosamine N-acyltransferase